MPNMLRILITVLVVLLPMIARAECELPEMRTDVRPDQTGAPTEVLMSIIVTDFLGVDDVNQQLDLDLRTTMSWHDQRLSGLEGCRFSITEVWFPKLLLFNSSQLRLARSNALNQVAIGEGGLVSYVQRYTGLISSYHNLRLFPFDRQEFKVRIGSVESGTDVLKLVPDGEGTWISDLLNIEGWNVGSVQLNSRTMFLKQSSLDVSVLELVISAERNSDYYMYRVILLLAFVVAMSWTIFWVPPSRFEFQIGLGATSMLTVIAFNLAIASNLPKLGYLTILDKILIWAIFLVFLSIVEALVAGLLVLNGREELADRMDKVSRFLFPAMLLGVWTGLIMLST